MMLIYQRKDHFVRVVLVNVFVYLKHYFLNEIYIDLYNTFYQNEYTHKLRYISISLSRRSVIINESFVIVYLL